ncbi:hypothetical protein KY290_037272 [Solanum tuberosum]|uniref:Uncharacterized protein n=1 Tax=Solanum tuberosum TaxID=4113 RepID=A0ABQ7TV14_SOLTU|nr:hypothetical protein KY290_037272 [Solanum tuberosum]
MKSPLACSNILLMILLIVLISITSYEAARILKYNNEKGEVDILKGGKYLLLQSLQWRLVGPPTSNPGTNVPNQITSQVTQRNFAGRKEYFAHPPPCNEYPHTKIAFGVATD